MQIHSTNLVSLTAKVAATGLCLSSAAFGALFAASVGIKHSIALAAITVLFVVALELIKPLALVAACLQELESRQRLSPWCAGRRGHCLQFDCGASPHCLQPF